MKPEEFNFSRRAAECRRAFDEGAALLAELARRMRRRTADFTGLSPELAARCVDWPARLGMAHRVLLAAAAQLTALKPPAPPPPEAAAPKAKAGSKRK